MTAGEQPHDLDAEKAVLGCLMSGAALPKAHALSADDFYRPAHQLIYGAIEALRKTGGPADPIAVANELGRCGTLGQMGGGPYLHDCLAVVPVPGQAAHYAGIVREHSERRRLIEYADRIRQAAHNPAEDLAVVRALAAGLPSIHDGHGQHGRRLVLTPASEIQPEPVVWVWQDAGHGRIPSGSLGLAAGREGTGKSSFAIWQAARVTSGTLPGTLEGTPRAVIYVAVEDSWRHTIVPRLMAAGADLARVYRAEVKAVEDETVTLSLPSDNQLLETAIREHDVALVVLDPLMSAISDQLDTHVNRQVRRALDPLAGIADRTGAVITGIAHFNKSTSTDASSLITASGAFKDVARFIFAFAVDEEDGAQVITQVKNSVGLSNLPSLAYRITEAIVPTAKGDAKVGRFVLDGESERSVRDILGGPGLAEERSEKTRAEDYLRKALAGGPRRSKEVEEEAREAHGISKHTLDRARKNMRIPAAQKPTGAPKRKDGPPVSEWWISLPEHEGDLRQVANAEARPQDGNALNWSDSQDASGPLGTAPWQSGNLPPRGEPAPQIANSNGQIASHNALTRAGSQNAKNANPPVDGTLPAWRAGANGHEPAARTCSGCGGPLDPVFIDLGDTAHPGCIPGTGWDPGTVGAAAQEDPR